MLATAAVTSLVAEPAMISCNECAALGSELEELLKAMQLHEGQTAELMRWQADAHHQHLL